MKLTIDPEFRDLIVPLKADELEKLEGLLIKNGCLDTLKTWNKTIVDGHNRYEICTRRNISFKIHEMAFNDRDAAMDWMDANQLGRRNLDKDEKKVIVGRWYNRTKKPRGGDYTSEEASGQNVQKLPKPPTTAETIGKEVGMDARTVRRAGEFVTAIGVLGMEDEVKKADNKRMDKKIIEASKSAIPELIEMKRIGEIDFKTCAAVAKLPHEEQRKAVLGGVYGVKNAAKSEAKKVEKPEARIKNHIPSDGKSCAVMAIIKLDRILDSDTEFEWAMNHIINYCKKRMNTNKQ